MIRPSSRPETTTIGRRGKRGPELQQAVEALDVGDVEVEQREIERRAARQAAPPPPSIVPDLVHRGIRPVPLDDALQRLAEQRVVVDDQEGGHATRIPREVSPKRPDRRATLRRTSPGRIAVLSDEKGRRPVGRRPDDRCRWSGFDRQETARTSCDVRQEVAQQVLDAVLAASPSTTGSRSRRPSCSGRRCRPRSRGR